MGKRLYETIKDILSCLLDILFPKNLVCSVCGKMLDGNNKHSLCLNCESQLKKVDNSISDKDKYSFDEINSVCRYEGLAREMVHRLKYNDRREIAISMASLISEITGYKDFDFVAAVPSYKKKKSKRGYNQAELIARELSDILGIPFIDKIERIRDTKPQVLFDSASRWYNVKDAFKCTSRFDGKRVILVDDVITTGATVHFCAKELKDSGASYVMAASFAKSII